MLQREPLLLLAPGIGQGLGKAGDRKVRRRGPAVPHVQIDRHRAFATVSCRMTRRSDILKILAIAALIGVGFNYLAHYGLSLPQR